MVTFTATAELFIDGAWVNITRIDDDTRIVGPITVTRGRGDEQSHVSPTEVTFSYLDNNATLDGDNPASPYYRKIGLATPLRVSIDGNIRAVVELVSVQPSWDETAGKVLSQVKGAGIMRRLEEVGRPLRSPAYRAITSTDNDDERIGYWPLEEESGATTIFSPYSGSVTTQGTINYGSQESMSSARLLTFGSVDASMFFTLPDWTNTLGQHSVLGTFRFPEASLLNNAIIWRMYFTGGNVDYVDLLWQTGDALSLLCYTGGALIGTIAGADFTGYIDNREVVIINTFNQNGADVDMRIRTTTADYWLVESSGTLSTRTLGRMYKIVVGTGAGINGLSFGQLIIGNNKDAFSNYISDLDTETPNVVVTGARGYLGERAGKRLTRLLGEEGLSITITGTDTDTERLDAQTGETLIDLLRGAEDADLGILYEHRAVARRLAYRTRVSLYDQAPTAILTYSHLTKPFGPSMDDLRVTNQMTAQRTGGGTAAYAIPDDDLHHWTTEDPPDGAGLRPGEVSLALYSDDQLPEQAAWRAHLQSWREKRFRTVTYELARTAFSADDRAALIEMGLGDVIWQGTSGAPGYVNYNEIRLLVQGYTETFGKQQHTITFNTIPADEYESDMTDVLGSSLAAPVTSGGTTIYVAPGDSTDPWSTTDEPYNIQVDGQPMTVTAMTTMTPTAGAAGTAAHGVNASVVPGLPAGMTPDIGTMMILVAGIRNSGTGTVDSTSLATAGWPLISAFGNMAVHYRYYKTGDTAPTVAFLNGAANEDTTARIFSFPGLSHTVDYDAQQLLNGSAANVNYTGYSVWSAKQDGIRETNLVHVIALWKQDDTSGVTAPAGFTKAWEASTTTGNDQSMALCYRIDTTATAVASSSATFAGGAAAISRAITIALRPMQQATVTRGIAGTATSASIGAVIRAWRSGVNGL